MSTTTEETSIPSAPAEVVNNDASALGGLVTPAGSNRAGNRPAPKRTPARKPAGKPASKSNARKPAGSARPTAQPARAAVKVKPAKSDAKPAGPSINERKRNISALIIKNAAEYVTSKTKLTDKMLRDLGTTREEFTALTGQYLSYLPNCEWDSRLGTRSDAGRRKSS